MAKVTNPQAWFGWRPDVPDKRDFKFHEHTAAPPTRPDRVDLRELCTKVEDQGPLGSCTGNAWVGLLEFMDRKSGDKTPENLSRLFVYYNERLIEGSVFEDSGAYIRDGAKALTKWGVPLESRWKYDIKQFAKKPGLSIYKQALQRRIGTYSRLQTPDDMINCLAGGYPFVFGFTVYSSFDRIGADGNMPYPDFNSESVLGGHAVLAVGYDLSATAYAGGQGGSLIVRNSWGADWGDHGYFYMPVRYAADRDLCDDFWTARH